MSITTMEALQAVPTEGMVQIGESRYVRVSEGYFGTTNGDWIRVKHFEGAVKEGLVSSFDPRDERIAELEAENQRLTEEAERFGTEIGRLTAEVTRLTGQVNRATALQRALNEFMEGA